MKAERVLFFGRENCQKSRRALAILKESFDQVGEVWSRSKSQMFPSYLNDWEGDYIFCYRSYFILPKKLIENAKKAAINFHPGPPEYPGTGCINFALYNDEKSYGVTSHFMSEKVDAGSIIAVKRFTIHETDTVESLLFKTHDTMLELFAEVISDIVKDPACLKDRQSEPVAKWVGKARRTKELDALYRIPDDATKQDMIRILRATSYRRFKPYIEKHGSRFYLLDDDELVP